MIDYSAPNVAKQMHVGHLRTTIIGDCFNRVLTAVGHRVLPQNHIGDWGTQFGMLVEQVLEDGIDASALTLPEAEALYKRGSFRFREDADFADRARQRVVALQSGDEQTRAIWRDLIDISLTGFNAAYDRLNVKLTDEHLAGESIYNDDLASVAAELEASGAAVIDQGALVVFVEGFNAPMIVRKSDGGYGYSITDLAAVRHRVRDLHADRIIYVTDARQGDHFAQVFAVCRLAGWLPDDVIAQHVGYGMVLGPDGKPYKTREGKAMLLADLLDMAEEQAAPPIALAAIKYADLSNGLNKDYVFDIDRMVQTTGNTGPYLQYAHARLVPGAAPGRGRGPGRGGEDRGAGRAGRADAGAAAHPVRRGGHRGGRHAAAAPAVRLPLRGGRRPVGVLRAVPGAEVRRRGAGLPARAVHPHQEGAGQRPGHARHRGPRPHVALAHAEPRRT